MDTKKTMKELQKETHQICGEGFFGQEGSKKVIFTMIEAAKKRGDQPGHILLYGPEGRGKKYFADIIAREIGNQALYINGGLKMIVSHGDLEGILTNMGSRNTLIIQDLDKMKLQVFENILRSAMEENALDIMIGKGPSARNVRLDLPRFTVIATVTNMNKISKRLQNSFELICKMVAHSSEDIIHYIHFLSEQTGIPIEEDAEQFIADASRGQMSRAKKLVMRLRDFAQVEGIGSIGLEYARERLSIVIAQEI